LPDETWTWKYDPRRVTAERYASIKRDLARLADAAGALSCPVLLLRGAESEVLSDTQAAEFAATLPDGHWAEVQAAGHNIQGDNPRELVKILADFLEQIEQRP
jgi:pimeloyl-ACP methyl ester carboxylesterase